MSMDCGTSRLLHTAVFDCSMLQDIIRIDINRWVVMLLIGIVTALIAVAIDICINLLASWKYSVIKNCILFNTAAGSI